MTIVILIGASGAGKTTIAQAIEARHGAEFDVFYFDRIGVPSPEVMIAEHGSGEAWQRAKTFEWIRRLAAVATPQRPILFEGQTRLLYLAEAAAAVGEVPYVPILVDCDDRTRAGRLRLERNQPDLADDTMMNWAKYLRTEALRNGCEILDTSALSLDDSVSFVITRLGKPAASHIG